MGICFHYIFLCRLLFLPDVRNELSYVLPWYIFNSACYLGLILCMRGVTYPSYLLLVFLITSFSMCGLLGGVYCWVPCLSSYWLNFYLCRPDHIFSYSHILMLADHSAATLAVSSLVHTVHIETHSTIVIEILQQVSHVSKNEKSVIFWTVPGHVCVFACEVF